MQDDILTLTHATERDIDLLLVEEFKCSTDFVRWFTERVAAATKALAIIGPCRVTHSRRRTHNRREIDICLEVGQGDALPIHILVENKLDTSEQFEQAESYRDEAAQLVSSGISSATFTALIAPKAYLGQHRTFALKFDATVPYEDIATFLMQQAESGGQVADRLRHRAELIEQAVTKSRRGYEAVPLANIEQFNAKYVSLLRARFPLLKPGPSMLKEGRPGESKTMIFAPDALPDWDFLPQMRIVHQLREANANVNFYGWGDQFVTLAGPMAADLVGTPYRIVPTVNKRANGRSGLMIVAVTPQVDNVSGFDAQSDAIIKGMEATEGLRSWIWEHSEVVRRWAALRSNG
jgi:hypothetical protein